MGIETLLRRSCILWNRTENTSLVSEIGVDGTNSGATFVGGKYGNGARIDASAEKISFVNFNVDLNSVAVGFWANTDYNIVNGVPSDSQFHDILSFTLTGNGSTIFSFTVHSAVNGIYIFRDGTLLSRDLTSDWNSGTWVHLLMVVDRSASFDGAKTSAIYVNGVQTSSDTTALSDMGVTASDLWFGCRSTGGYPFDGILDNLKTESPITANLVTDAIANKDFEGFKDKQAIII